MKALYEKHGVKLHYLLVGGWNTIFGYGVFVVLHYATVPLHIHYEVVLILSQIISVTSAYLLYKKFVFRTKGHYFQEYCRFWAFYWLSLLANVVLLPLLVEVLHQDLILSQALLIVLSAVTSYFWHANHTFSFARKAGPS
ncbi:GtrA family protein [Nitrospira sp. Nam74]